LADQYPARLLCDLVDVPPSSFYYHPLSNDDLQVLALIEEVLLEYPTYGYRRVTVQLNRSKQYYINHKRVLRLMQEHDLVQAARRRVSTTNSNHHYGRYPNLVKGLDVVRPDQVWCGDITYIRLQRQFVYLAILIDVYTRSIRGWHLGRSLSSSLALQALEQALQHRRPEVHHSDQGIQYAATGYVERLEAVASKISMAAVGQPTENPYAERVIRTIKEEEVYLSDYLDLADARDQIGRFIDDVYQTKRIHSALGYLPPAEFEAAYWLAQGSETMALIG
jgi:putative transposase